MPDFLTLSVVGVWGATEQKIDLKVSTRHIFVYNSIFRPCRVKVRYTWHLGRSFRRFSEKIENMHVAHELLHQ
jgi:hypothetical protein